MAKAVGTSKTIEIAGESIHYFDFGGEGRLLILVHGLGGSYANWLAVGPALAEHAHVVAIDLPGFGLSRRSARGTGMNVLSATLSAFIDALSSEPVFLMGNSMGGALSVFETSARPERVEAAVLVCPALPPAPEGKLDRAFMTMLLIAAAPYGHRLLTRRSAKLGARQLVHEMMRLCNVDPSRIPEAVLEAHVELNASRASRPWTDQAFGEATRSLMRYLFLPRGFRAALKALCRPTLILHGQRDRLVDVHASRGAVAVAPQIELMELPDLGHTPQLEAPEVIVDLATRFFARASSKAKGSDKNASANH